jgi:GH43 family beta-xylosidase
VAVLVTAVLTGALTGPLSGAGALALPAGGAAPAAAADPAVPAPAAHYPLLTDARDVVGGADGTAIGAVTFAGEGAVLPGGTSSATNYVDLPGSAFAGTDEITVSAWVRAVTGAGNYAALSFGTPAQANRLPLGYWLLNPTNPSGAFKTVVTDGSSPTAPWSTEVGTSGPSTTSRVGVWSHYTTVIRDGSITGYIDGVEVGRAARSTALSDLGPTLEAAIGRSEYLDDPTWAGTVQDLRVYRTALDGAQVSAVFGDAATTGTRQVVVDRAAAALSLGDTGAVTADLTLPATAGWGTAVAWRSSDPGVVDATGRVTGDGLAVLTATVTAGDATAERDFTVRVPAAVLDAGAAAALLRVPAVLEAGTTLPATIAGAAGADVAWATSDPALVAASGAVIGGADGLGLRPVTVTATVTLGGSTAVKAFDVRVSERTPAGAISYTRAPAGILASSMHLAVRTDDGAYQALHLGQGVLFALADFDADPLNGVTHGLADPAVFRMADGTFGVLATRTDAAGAVDAATADTPLLFTSPDLVAYTEVGPVDLGATGPVLRPQAELDGSTGEYRVTWQDADGLTWASSTADLATFTAPTPAGPTTGAVPDSGIADAVERSAVVLTRAEADVLLRRFGPVVNTTVDAPTTVTVPVGTDLAAADLGRAVAHYSDGSSAAVTVDWDATDLAAIDTTTPGSHQVDGTVRVVDLGFPMIDEPMADPQVFRYDGRYHLIATNEGGGQKQLFVRSADTLAGLATAPRSVILTDTTRLAWAPEVHEIDGRLYLSWARGPAWNQVRSTVAALDVGGDPAVAADWDWAGAREVVRADGLPIQPDGITLDLTYTEVAGTWYAIWSDRVVTPTMGTADLKIATIDPADPGRLTSEPVTIARPDYGWDRNTGVVDEGPNVLLHDGEVVVTFSGANVNQSYVLATLRADVGADLLDPASWRKDNAPSLTSANIAGEYGPGHNAYLTDADGTLLQAVHAVRSYGSGTRYSTVRAVHWGAFGNLVLDLTADRQVLPANRAVQVTVTVVDPAVTPDPGGVPAPGAGAGAGAVPGAAGGSSTTAAGSGAGSGVLATTGAADVPALVALALVLLGSGALVLVLRRRGTRTA